MARRFNSGDWQAFVLQQLQREMDAKTAQRERAAYLVLSCGSVVRKDRVEDLRKAGLTPIARSAHG